MSDGESSLPPSEQDSLLRAVAGMNDPPGTVALTPGEVIDETYRIVRELGSGGMGVVYLARDLRLDRDVALKLHASTDPDAAAALRREATVMARFVHPAVVTVHEVGEYRGHPFVAMEYVDGGTARTWLREQPRGWRETLALYLTAARGLVAAHEAGLVHRDFKPDNLLVGRDGRVRVADFGLARPPSENDAGSGTPGYMAPEQRSRGEVGPAADQYAFCVALSQALHGTRPATATTAQTRPTRAVAPAPLARTRGVPSWIDAALERGLAETPGQRWPSMAALIEALENDPTLPRRRRLRVAAVALAVIVPTVAAIALLRRGGEDPHAMCAQARDRTIGVWDPARRAMVHDTFVASGRPGAADTFDHVAAALDQRTDEWVAARIDTCEATHVRGEQSPELLDVRMRCLDQHLREESALVDLFRGGTSDAVDNAVAAVEALPSLDDCHDAAPHTPDVPPELALRVAAVAARHAAGLDADALALADGVIADTGDDPTAEFAVTHADLLDAAGKYDQAETEYQHGVKLATTTHDDRSLFDAWLGRLQLRIERDQLDGADELADAAEAAAIPLPADDLAHARLDETRALLRLGQGRFADGLALATHAHDALATRLPGTVAEANALDYVARAQEASGAFADALATYQRVIDVLVQRLGVDHPTIAGYHEDHARILTDLSRFDEARAELDGVIAPVERAYGADSPRRATLADTIAELDRSMGRYDDATAEYQRALAIDRRLARPVEAARSLVGLGIIADAKGDEATARRFDEEAVAAAREAGDFGTQILGGALVYLGSALEGLGDLHGAMTTLEEALAVRTRLYGRDNVQVAQVENSLGSDATWLGDHARAEALLRHAITVEEAALGADAIDPLYAHHNLGTDLADQGRWPEALAEHEHALAGLERVIGHDNPVLAAPLSMLAYEYAQVGRFDDGVAAGQRAAALLQAAGQPPDGFVELGLGAALWPHDHAAAVRHVRAAIAAFEASPDDPAGLVRARAWLRAH